MSFHAAYSYSGLRNFVHSGEMTQLAQKGVSTDEKMMRIQISLLTVVLLCLPLHYLSLVFSFD